jgi:hypothetical protein
MFTERIALLNTLYVFIYVCDFSLNTLYVFIDVCDFNLSTLNFLIDVCDFNFRTLYAFIYVCDFNLNTLYVFIDVCDLDLFTSFVRSFMYFELIIIFQCLTFPTNIFYFLILIPILETC